jgi:hypothetical protein
MNANNGLSTKANAEPAALPRTRQEDVQRLYEAMIDKLQRLERLQQEAANGAPSEAAARRHRELAQGIATACDFLRQINSGAQTNY